MEVLSYVLPLRTTEPNYDLVPYLRALAGLAEVIVVDGSPPDVFRQHRQAFAPPVRHVPLDPRRRTAMGKVGGVLAGVELASHEHVVIADDDVRYTASDLGRMDELLARAEVVRPQNWFYPLPWHARWDTGRILLNRLVGGDWPGTLGVRRSALLAAGGYAGDVLFENLELVRTIELAGGRSITDLDLLVRRLPPSTEQFLNQRVRQAYDEMARPWRLAVFLAVLPAFVFTSSRPRLAMVASTLTLAELGRRRGDGCRMFPPTSALWAPLWVAERAITSWLALVQRCRGGVRYRGARLRRAATPRGELRARVGSGRLRASVNHVDGADAIR